MQLGHTIINCTKVAYEVQHSTSNKCTGLKAKVSLITQCHYMVFS